MSNLGRVRVQRGASAKGRHIGRQLPPIREIWRHGGAPRRHASPQDLQAATTAVAAFLRQYYWDAPHNIEAARRAVEALATNVHAHSEICRAFRIVLAADHADFALTQLVGHGAGHNVGTDAEALQFLRQVYDETYLDDAIDFDELEEERLEIERADQRTRERGIEERVSAVHS